MPDDRPATGDTVPKLVTVDLKLSGKGVPNFPFRQFTDRAELPADKAKKLVEFWQKLLTD